MRNPVAGFTLIELVIVIVLLGILAAIGSNMLSESFTTTRIVNSGNANAAEARYALERVAREIREIKYDTVNNQYCIYATPSLAANMSASNLVFYKTTSGAVYSSTCATNAYLVTVNATGTNLSLQAAALSTQVALFSLSYLDSNNCVTTLINNSVGTPDCATTGGLTAVVIQLTVTDSISGQNIAQRVRVALRNDAP